MSKSPLENLRVWKEGIELSLAVYDLTSQLPKDKRYGLVSQMRRCAVSIPSNIAEGSQRGLDNEFAHFIAIAKGSIAELQTQLCIAQELQYASEDSANTIFISLHNLRRQLGSLHTILKKPVARG